MTLRFIYGRTGTGKTRRCLDEVAAELARRPEGPPLVVLVPEQATFQTEQALLASEPLRGFPVAFAVDVPLVVACGCAAVAVACAAATAPAWRAARLPVATTLRRD